MTPRDLVEKWRTRAEGYRCEQRGHEAARERIKEHWAAGSAASIELCILELEAALVEAGDGWMLLADAPLGVPLELWGKAPGHGHRAGAYPLGGYIGVRKRGIVNDEDLAEEMRRGFTHARLVTPPPGESE